MFVTFWVSPLFCRGVRSVNNLDNRTEYQAHSLPLDAKSYRVVRNITLNNNKRGGGGWEKGNEKGNATHLRRKNPEHIPRSAFISNFDGGFLLCIRFYLG